MSEATPWLRKLEGKWVVDDLFDLPRLMGANSWQPFRVGIEIFPLYGDYEGRSVAGPSAALLRYGPGASVPPHEHPGHEHVVVLQGSQRDAQQTYGRGSFVISEPGSRHAVASDDGCVVLVIWNLPVSFLEEGTPSDDAQWEGLDP